MEKKGIYIFLLLLFLFLTLGIFWKLRQKRLPKVFVGEVPVSVEIANSEAEKQKGLSERKELCHDCGLLFVFDKPGRYSFWMHKMYFDIDILWILEDRVVDITECAKKPSVEEFASPKEIYQPKVPVNKVLEVNCGWVKNNNIQIGDKFSEN